MSPFLLRCIFGRRKEAFFVKKLQDDNATWYPDKIYNYAPCQMEHLSIGIKMAEKLRTVSCKYLLISIQIDILHSFYFLVILL